MIIMTVAHDNLFSYASDHLPSSYSSVNYANSILFDRMGLLCKICWHVAALTYDKKFHSSHTSVFGRGHQTNTVCEAR